MAEETKIVNFPSSRRARRSVPLTDDEKLAHNVHAAWKKLWRAIDEAKTAGLKVDVSDNRYEHPMVTRKY